MHRTKRAVNIASSGFLVEKIGESLLEQVTYVIKMQQQLGYRVNRSRSKIVQDAKHKPFWLVSFYCQVLPGIISLPFEWMISQYAQANIEGPQLSH